MLVLFVKSTHMASCCFLQAFSSLISSISAWIESNLKVVLELVLPCDGPSADALFSSTTTKLGFKNFFAISCNWSGSFAQIKAVQVCCWFNLANSVSIRDMSSMVLVSSIIQYFRLSSLIYKKYTLSFKSYSSFFNFKY